MLDTSNLDVESWVDVPMAMVVVTCCVLDAELVVNTRAVYWPTPEHTHRLADHDATNGSAPTTGVATLGVDEGEVGAGGGAYGTTTALHDTDI